MDRLIFAKMKSNAVIPSKREEDGCYDIYACFDEDYIYLVPGEIKLIPTGIASAFDKQYRVSLRERGSTGTKGLKVNAGQIDSGYRGEWFVPINNTTNKPIVIYKDEEIKNKYASDTVIFYPYTKAITQAALEIVPVVKIVESSYEDILLITSERGSGMLGSSGK